MVGAEALDPGGAAAGAAPEAKDPSSERVAAVARVGGAPAWFEQDCYITPPMCGKGGKSSKGGKGGRAPALKPVTKPSSGRDVGVSEKASEEALFSRVVNTYPSTPCGVRTHCDKTCDDSVLTLPAVSAM